MLNKAVINLTNLKGNALAVKKLLPRHTRLCAVVKADGYGHGGVAVASAIYKEADCFAVALVEEGAELRYGGIDKEILVLGRSTVQDAFMGARLDLTLTAACLQDLIAFARVGKSLGKCLRVHIKYNTGMNRLGVDGLSDLKAIMDYAKNCPFVRVCGLYSHYACPQIEAERVSATRRFMLAKRLAKEYNKDIICHISASGGTLCGEYFDMVRIGILLYGYTPFESSKISVKPVMRIYAPVVGRRKLDKGEGALYGLKRADKGQDISIIRYGYADGLERREVDGQYSNRCMDSTAVIGVRNSAEYYPVLTDAEALAEKYSTISYEILTRAAIRAQKIYKY